MPKKVRTESKSNKLENPNKLDWKKKRGIYFFFE